MPEGRDRDVTRSDIPRALRHRRAHGGIQPGALPPRPARQPGRKRDLLLVATGAAIVAVLGGLTLWTLDASRSEESARGQPLQVPLGAAQTALPPLVQTPLPLSLPTALPEGAGAIDSLTGQPAAVPAAPLPAPAPAPVLAAPPEAAAAAPTATGPAEDKPRNRNASPALVFDAGASEDPGAEAGAPVAAPAEAAPRPRDGTAEVSRSAPLTAAPAAARQRAATARGARLTRGTLIPAVLETAIDAARPGFVRAVVSTDIRSSDGRRVLVERSSRLVGQYRARAGDGRAYVVWTRLTRPGGAAVSLGAPGGEFFDSFGKASLLSVVAGARGAGAARVRPGEPIRVFTGKDLDL